MKKTKFYTYDQNNSGGRFHSDKKAGIGYCVIIEATSADEADKRAEEIGLYFDGCETDRDCSCCGDRWSRAYFSEGKSTPQIYGQNVSRGVYKSGGMGM